MFYRQLVIFILTRHQLLRDHSSKGTMHGNTKNFQWARYKKMQESFLYRKYVQYFLVLNRQVLN